MSTYRRLRAVFQLALISAVCWGLVAVVLYLIVAVASGRGLSAWSPIGPFLVFGFYGLVAGAAFAVFLGLRRPDSEGIGLSPGRAISFGGVGGILVFLLFGVVVPGAFHGVYLGSLIGGATMFSVIGALTGVGIQRVAKRGALPPGTDIPKSIAP